MKNEDVKNKKSLTSYSDFKKHVKKVSKNDFTAEYKNDRLIFWDSGEVLCIKLFKK